MQNKHVPNATIAAFVMGVELTDRFPQLPHSGTQNSVALARRAETGFLLQSLSNLGVKKRGRRSGGRSSFCRR